MRFKRASLEPRLRALYTPGVFCVAFSLAIVRASAGDPQSGIFGNDDRRVIEQLNPPWGAIGQINTTGYRRTVWCTGSLIATNLVITAAHCVMNPWSRKPFPLHQIHFLAGVRGSRWLGHSTAKCLHFPPDYEYVGPGGSLPSQEVPRRAFSRDVVLIVLKDDLNNIAPLELDRAPVQSSNISLVHASYPADRRYTAYRGAAMQLNTAAKSIVYALNRAEPRVTPEQSAPIGQGSRGALRIRVLGLRPTRWQISSGTLQRRDEGGV